MGARIVARRESMGLTQIDLAKRSGVKQPALSGLENGTSKSISGENLAKLCRELRLTPEFLLWGGPLNTDESVAIAEAEAAYIIRSISKEQRDMLLTMARSLLKPTQPVLMWDGGNTYEARPPH
jgi:transcriptional regulator with XRE-family HTH domain